MMLFKRCAPTKPHIRKCKQSGLIRRTYICELRFYRNGYGLTPYKAWRAFLFNNQSARRSVVSKREVHVQENS